MKEIRQYELLLAKLVVIMQTQLELMDEMKNTTMYRQDVKFLTNKLEKEMEKYLNKAYIALDDEEKERSFMALQRGVRNIIDSSLEEIYIQSGETE
jgi:hypothetical protein